MIVITRHSPTEVRYAGACDSAVVRHAHELTVFLTDHTGAATGELHLVTSEARELWERLGAALGEGESATETLSSKNISLLQRRDSR